VPSSSPGSGGASAVHQDDTTKVTGDPDSRHQSDQPRKTVTIVEPVTSDSEGNKVPGKGGPQDPEKTDDQSEESRSTGSYSGSGSDHSSYSDYSSDYTSSSWSGSSGSYSRDTRSRSDGSSRYSHSFSGDESGRRSDDIESRPAEVINKSPVTHAGALKDEMENPPSPTDAKSARIDHLGKEEAESGHGEKGVGSSLSFDEPASAVQNRTEQTEEMLPLISGTETRGPKQRDVAQDDVEEIVEKENTRVMDETSYSMLTTTDIFDEEDPPDIFEMETDPPRYVTVGPVRNGSKRSRVYLLIFIVLVFVVSIVVGVLVDRLAPASGGQVAEQAPTSAPTSSFLSREWTQVGESFVGLDLRDQAGFAVSLSDDGMVVAVGARRTSTDGLVNRGKVWVYRYESNGKNWIEEAKFDGEAEGSQFGFSVSLSGNGRRLAVGSIGDDVNGENSGMVQVFHDRGNTWDPVGEFRGQGTGDVFGISVSMSQDGRSVAVGAPYNAADGMYRSGAVHFYEDIGFESSPRWEETRAILSGSEENDWFGWSVSLSGDGSRIAIGAPLSPDRRQPGYGAVYKFTRIDGMWSRIGPKLSRGFNGDRYGYSLSLNAAGNRLAVGAFRSSLLAGEEAMGLAIVYRLRGSDWSILGDVLQGMNAGDNFGYSVSLSRDGDYLAVGAPNHEQDGGTGLTRIFQYSGSLWVSSREIVSDVKARLGFSVSLSPNGNRVAVGLPLANQARVYD